MKKYLIFSLSSFCLFLSFVAQATQPKNFEAVYKAKFRGIPVTATRSLETLEDGSRRFSFVADSWLAGLKESTLFRWGEHDRIVPIQYHYQRTGLGKEREAVLDFDWASNKVVNNVQQKPWRMDVPDQALDKLSYQLQIRADLINGKPLLEYNIADGGRLKQYQFEVIGEEEVRTAAGRFLAVKVKRLRDNEDRHTIFWMAKNWDYMIVRLQQQEDDGASYEIDLHKAVLDGKPVKGY